VIRRKKNGRERHERRGDMKEKCLLEVLMGGWDAKSLDAMDVTNEMGCLVSTCEKWIHIAGCMTFPVDLGGFSINE
jgi:hypothetical protein